MIEGLYSGGAASLHFCLDGPERAPALVMSHSLFADKWSWRPQFNEFRRSFRVLIYDSRGHGKSSVSPPPYTLSKMAQDIAGLIRALGLQPVHFMGLSMGGMIAQVVALEHPEVIRSLVLCNTRSENPPGYAKLWMERLPMLDGAGRETILRDHILPGWFTDDFRKRHEAIVYEVCQVVRGTHVDGLCGAIAAISELATTPNLGRIRCPTLVIAGEKDRLTTVADAGLLADRIPGAELVIMKDTAHLSSLENPETFNRAVGNFLGRLDG